MRGPEPTPPHTKPAPCNDDDRPAERGCHQARALPRMAPVGPCVTRIDTGANALDMVPGVTIDTNNWHWLGKGYRSRSTNLLDHRATGGGSGRYVTLDRRTATDSWRLCNIMARPTVQMVLVVRATIIGIGVTEPLASGPATNNVCVATNPGGWSQPTNWRNPLGHNGSARLCVCGNRSRRTHNGYPRQSGRVGRMKV